MTEPNVLIITHIAFNPKTGQPVEGPYTSVGKAMAQIFNRQPSFLEIPLKDFEGPIIYRWDSVEKLYRVPRIFGKIATVKYITDSLLSLIVGLIFVLRNKENALIIGIDPLTTWVLTLLTKLFKFKLVFYCVDFSQNRSSQSFFSRLYKLADRISSQRSNQVWVVCEALQEYKKANYNINSFYIPNSFPFDPRYSNNLSQRTQRRTVWTGSILTDRQIQHIFRLCKEIQKLRPEMEFSFIPSNHQENFQKAILVFDLKNAQVFNVPGQEESRQIVSTCDLGLAIYDKEHGSTKYIEPIKIWEYMMCGLPFIISREPSLNRDVINAGVAYQLAEDNEIPQDGSLKQFIDPNNLERRKSKCIELAQKYDVVKTVKESINLI